MSINILWIMFKFICLFSVQLLSGTSFPTQQFQNILLLLTLVSSFPLLIVALLLWQKCLCRAHSPYRKDPVKMALQITVDPVQCWHTWNLLLFLQRKVTSSFSEAAENAFSSVLIQGSSLLPFHILLPVTALNELHGSTIC